MYIYPPKLTEIYHFGVSKRNGAKVGSGRYPLGSGKRPYQDSDSHAVKVAKVENKMAAKHLRNKGTSVILRISGYSLMIAGFSSLNLAMASVGGTILVGNKVRTAVVDNAIEKVGNLQMAELNEEERR